MGKTHSYDLDQTMQEWHINGFAVFEGLILPLEENRPHPRSLESAPRPRHRTPGRVPAPGTLLLQCESAF